MSTGLFDNVLLWVAVVVVLQFLDWLTTYKVLRLGGREGNPVLLRLAAWLSARGFAGHAWLNFAKFGAVCLVLLLPLLPDKQGVLWGLRAVAAIYVFVVINNSVVWRRQWLRAQRNAGGSV